MGIEGLITPRKSIEMPNQSGIPLQWTFDHLDAVLRKFGVERSSFQTPLLVNDKDSTGSLADDLSVINQTADPSVRFRSLVKKPFLIGRNKVPQVSSIGGHLDTLYIAPNTHPSLKDELKQIAEFKDFKLEELNSPSPWLGNSHTPLANGKFYIPFLTKNPMAYAIAASIFSGSIPELDWQAFQGEVPDNIKRSFLSSNKNLQEGKCYLEAGNMMPVQKETGENLLLIGSDSLYMSMLILQDQNYFFDPKTHRASDELAEMFRSIKDSDPRIDEITANMLDEKKTLLLFSLLNSGEIQGKNIIRENWEALQPILKQHRLSLTNTPDPYRRRMQAKEMLAKLELTKRYIAKDLNMNPNDILFIPQAAKAHLDLSMRAHPDGGLLLHDDKLVTRFLDSVKTNDEFKKMAELRADLNDKRQKALVKLLENNGVRVYRIPGIFHAGDGTTEANFMNGRSFKDKEGRTCYILFGCNYPKIQAAFAEMMINQYGFDEIYFVGRSGKAYTVGDSMLKRQGGLGCITCAVHK